MLPSPLVANQRFLRIEVNVAGFEDLHLVPAAAAALDAMGWSAGDALAREMAPTAARGHNLVAVTPPSPAYAAPALAGLLGRVGGERAALLLCPSAELDEWSGMAHQLARGLPVRAQVARGEARAMRRLRAGSLDLLIATPETATALLRRSALKVESLAAVFMAWPERFDDADALTALMHDLPKDAQRIIFTAAPERAADFVERYARKALTVGAPAPETAEPEPAGAARTVSVAWNRRAAALGELIEMLDPASLVVWAADRAHDAAIARALPLADADIHLVTGDADLPKAEFVVAYDLPSAAQFRRMLEAGEVVLLVPPDTDAYVSRLVATRRPIRLPSLLDAVTQAAAARRIAVARKIEEGTPDRALLTLAPLFERYDSAAVAAALYELWTGAAGTATPGAVPDVPATSKIYVGVGKKDNATANDLVAVLVKDLRVDRTKIGRIELRDNFTLVDVPAQDAERIAQALNGQTIRRRRITARVDRGPVRPEGREGGRPAGREGGPPSRSGPPGRSGPPTRSGPPGRGGPPKRRAP